MNDRERLEEIKRTFLHSDSDEIAWLIQQAGRVQELEEEIHEVRVNCKAWYDNFFLAKEETQRYKQALEFYANEDNYELRGYFDGLDENIHDVDSDKGEKARKALGEN
jgi:predicted unusual protein kinase regulating ubiquinone biosynthesis (AarF/ABC1/UbiB family)